MKRQPITPPLAPTEIIHEPGMEERFQRALRKALNTAPLGSAHAAGMSVLQLAESITRITNELTVIDGDTFLRPSLQRVVTELCQGPDPPSPREIETAVELLAQAAAAAGDMVRANYLRSRLIEGLDFGVRPPE